MEGLSGSASAGASCAFVSALALQPNPPRLHGLSNILEELRSHVITDEINLALHLTVGVVGHADATRFCDSLKTCGNVDTVAENVVVIDDDVADVNAYSKCNPFVLRH